MEEEEDEEGVAEEGADRRSWPSLHHLPDVPAAYVCVCVCIIIIMDERRHSHTNSHKVLMYRGTQWGHTLTPHINSKVQCVITVCCWFFFSLIKLIDWKLINISD